MRACVCVLTALPGAELTHECGPQAGTRPNDLNLDEMVDLKQMPREERISLMNARLLAKYKEMNVIETQTRDLGAKKKKTTLEEELEWEMEADASAWEEAVDSHFGGSAKLQMTIGEEKIAASRQARIKEQTQANLIHRRDVNTMEVFVWCLRRIAAVSISVLCATVSCLWLIRLRRAVLTAASGWIRSTRAFFQVLCCYFENPEERN